MNKNSLIFLMDFDGHPGLADEFVENYRTYALQDIINDSYLDREKCVIVSTALSSQGSNIETRSNILCKQAVLDKGWTWLKVDKTKNFSYLEHELSKVGFTLSPEDTTIVYGGTNTSGCVLHSSNFSLNKFVGKGHFCQLYLPLCDDTQIAGITSFDRSQKAFALVYKYLKDKKYIDSVDMITMYGELNLVKSDKRFDYIST